MSGEVGKLSQKLAKIAVTNKKLCFWTTLVISLFFASGNMYFGEKNDVRIWFTEDDPNIAVLDKFEASFGNDEGIVMAIHSPSGIFDNDSLQMIHDVTERMWRVHEVVRVDSLTNYNYSFAEEDDIFVESFVSEDSLPLSDEELARKKDIAENHEVLPNYLVSKDLKSALVFARLVTTPNSSPNYQKIVEETRKVQADLSGKGDHKLYIIGEAAVNDAFREFSVNDNAFILPLLFVLLIFYLMFTFRSVLATILPLAVIVLSVIATLGVGFVFGIKLNAVLAILPAILIAIGIADSAHVVTTYFQFKGKGLENKEAAYEALKKNVLPTFLTTISTSIGFLSLSFTKILPIRELGHLSAFGSMMCWILTLFLVGPCLAWFDFKVPKHFKNEGEGENSIPWYIVSIRKNKILITLSFLSAAFLSLYFGSKVNINSNPYEFFTSDVAIRQADDFIKKTFGGNFGPELLIHTGKEDGIKDPVFLKKVDQLKSFINEKPYVNKTVDIVNVVKDINRSFHGGNQEYYRIPNSQEEVAQYLLFYTLGLPQGMGLNNMMTYDYEAMRMTVVWSITDSRGWLEKTALIENKAKELGLDLEVTGKFHLFQSLLDYLVTTFFFSILSAFILIAILLMLVFKSVKTGLLSLIPNVIPLFFGGALMYFTGMDLNIGTALVASVTFGIAVDDTIHFITSYTRGKIQNPHNLDLVMTNVFKTTGNALIITTLILSTCFALNMLGHFIPNVNFGMLSSLVLTVALVVDLIMLPALLYWVDDTKEA